MNRLDSSRGLRGLCYMVGMHSLRCSTLMFPNQINQSNHHTFQKYLRCRHQLYRIDEITQDGELILQTERYKVDNE